MNEEQQVSIYVSEMDASASDGRIELPQKNPPGQSAEYGTSFGLRV